MYVVNDGLYERFNYTVVIRSFIIQSLSILNIGINEFTDTTLYDFAHEKTTNIFLILIS